MTFFVVVVGFWEVMGLEGEGVGGGGGGGGGVGMFKRFFV